MKTENLGGIIVGGIVAGATLGVGYMLAQKLMNKVSKPKAEEVIVSTKPMALPETSGIVGTNLVKNESWSNAWGSPVRKGGKVPCNMPGYNSTVMANSAAACTGAGGKVIKS